MSSMAYKIIRGLETIKNYEGYGVEAHDGEIIVGYEGIVNQMSIVDQNTMLSNDWHECDGYWRIYL